jgi:transcription elongation factor Elf1
MRGFTRHFECLRCANCRSFIQHGETSQRLIGQGELGTLSPTATLSCGYCGSFSLRSWWDGATAYMSTAYILGRLRAPTAGPIEQ